MSIISTEEQDKRWAALSEQEKDDTIDAYHKMRNYGTKMSEIIASDCMRRLYGEHNLVSKIKTWKDFLKEFHKETDWNPKHELADLSLYGITDKVKAKIIATAKIAKLIEFGYGGTVTDAEWKNYRVHKYCVVLDMCGKLSVECKKGNSHEFIAFHTYQQAEEFINYPENRKLVEQYNMI